jgi:hypothetical protein
MATARRWLRAVLYRSGMQFGWFWLACVVAFAAYALPDGRWNRTFDRHAIGTVTRSYADAEDGDIRLE